MIKDIQTKDGKKVKKRDNMKNDERKIEVFNEDGINYAKIKHYPDEKKSLKITRKIYWSRDELQKLIEILEQEKDKLQETEKLVPINLFTGGEND